MKKQLTLTLIIGSLSLLGILYVELSWLKINIKLQKANIENKIINILQETKNEITGIINKKTYFIVAPKYTKLKRPKIKILQSDFNSILISAAFYLNAETITHKLKTKFDDVGLGKLKFEYGIIKNNILSLTSVSDKENFISQINAPQNNQTTYKIYLKYHESTFPLKEENKNDETLYLLIFNDSFSIIKDYLGYTILIIILFTTIVLYIFYATLNFILRQDKIDIMKTNFINNMTHEFKTPISAIKIATELLKPEIAQSNPNDFKEYVDMIKQENNRMLLLVETILDNASLARGEIRLDKIFIPVHELLKEFLESYKIIIQNKNGKLITMLNAQRDMVLVDNIHIRNAITNIIDNSIKYTQEGHNPQIIIRTENDNEYVYIFIEDNGIGIGKQHLKKVFEKFYRVNNKDIHNVKGFGLGLNYTRAIIEAHKGSISIQSTLNVGTIIKIALPLMENKI